MPCESCNVQFTVFRRKRSCPDCKRFYCSNCLSSPPSPGRNSGALCERCSIFAKRPLQRADLLRLKPKDLIFFLQSKHISTAGCVEKEELVLLVLNHVQQNDANNARSCNGGQSPSNSSGRRDAESAHSFEGLKQSCQNFFSNISDNISDSFTSFESKAASKNSQNNGTRTQSASNNCTPHIIDQPRVSTREIPTYASFQSGQTQPAASISVAAGVQVVEPTSGGTNIVNRPPSVSLSLPTSNEASNSQTTSPLASLSSLASHAPGNSNSQGRRTLGCPLEVSTSAYNRDSHSGDGEVHSECECSDDDEIITAFSERVASERSENLNLLGDALRSTDHVAAAATPSTSSGAYAKQGTAPTSRGDACDGDQSSHSSFEELGAIGGISDDSKTTTDTNSSHVDQWQLLDTQRPSVPVINAHDVATDDGGNLQVALLPSHDNPEPPLAAQRNKKVMRRRSDGHLNRRRSQSDDDSPTGAPSGNLVLHEVHEMDATLPAGRRQGHEPLSNCERCGKRRANIRRYIERMRRHLENAQLSEEEIKSELNAFLIFLEKRSVECSDSETAVSSVSGTNCPQATPGMPVNLQEDVLYGIDENDGIYVYGTSFVGCGGTGKISSRFINLDDYASVDDLDSLSVKQLKEVLMLNRVDYKGCCEKQELLDRVQRLWKNLKSTPAVDKLQTDELCKICMDAPIECVILECGHMATCTNCGKVLSECPICRQYIVRVVRFFRA